VPQSYKHIDELIQLLAHGKSFQQWRYPSSYPFDSCDLLTVRLFFKVEGESTQGHHLFLKDFV
tara:strand:+ start:526 stop:714 length:189 start_codon:yes stop_codon:yes gene_type:complete